MSHSDRVIQNEVIVIGQFSNFFPICVIVSYLFDPNFQIMLSRKLKLQKDIPIVILW